MTAPDLPQLRQRYEEAGQDHVFAFWDTLSDDEQLQLSTQLDSIDPIMVTKIAKESLQAANDAAVKGQDQDQNQDKCTIEPLQGRASDTVLDCSQEQLDSWRSKGLEAIAQNKVAVVLLAGGQGTRLGSSDPKGCYDIQLPSQKSLFQLQAERIAKISELAQKSNPSSTCDVDIPWYIMTSGPTKHATKEFFEKNNFFGLKKENIKFFEQGTLPCLSTDGKILMQDKHTVAVAPDGNGGVYNALHRSGVLQDMKKRQIEHVHTYCVDNCLVKVADPVFIGYSLEREVDIATKVVRKRDAQEKVGLIVSKNGKPAVIEYSEITSDLAEAKDERNPSLLKLRAANIVNHYYSAKFLYAIPDWQSTYLPFHIASKKIPCVNMETGEFQKPASPNGVKLEQFVFDVFPNLSLDQFACLEVSRDEEFSPLKNGPGSKEDSPETSRQDVLERGARWLKNAGAIVEDGAQVEVSSLTSYAGEGLSQFKGKRVSGGIV